MSVKQKEQMTVSEEDRVFNTMKEFTVTHIHMLRKQSLFRGSENKYTEPKINVFAQDTKFIVKVFLPRKRLQNYSYLP